MNLELIADSARLAALARPWNVLAAGSPLLSWEWMTLWWKHYGQPLADAGRASPYVVAVWDGDVLAGLAPWYAQRSRGGRRTLRFLGSGEVCTDYLTLMTLPGREEAVVEAVADFLLPRRSRPAQGAAQWHAIDWDGVDAKDETMLRLAGALARRGALTFERPGMRTWRIELPPTIGEFADTFSKTRRKQIRKWLGEIETGAPTVHMAGDAAELARGWEIFVDLHQRRRHVLGQPGCFASPQFAAFHAEVARALLASGQLQLTWVEWNGRPGAIEYMLVGGGVAYCYQSGIEPDLAQRQPGHIAVLATIVQAIRCGCNHYDFMRGDEPYKARWHAEPRESIRLRAWPGRGADRVRRQAAIQYEALRSWVRSRRERAAQSKSPPAVVQTQPDGSSANSADRIDLNTPELQEA